MKALSIYVHIPFCEKRCPYCDFFSQVGGNVGEYINTLLHDIKASVKSAKSYTVTTVYIGGGTPSLLEPAHITAILNTIRENYTVAPDAEISIECNPNSLTREKLTAYKKAGINRISIGVQSFRLKGLKILGRIHNVKQAKAAIKLACEHFENVSIDLIHSIPGARAKLPRKYLSMVKHVSAYALTSDNFPPVDDGVSIKEQRRIERILYKCGLEKYEVSNFARVGYECKHNLVYWTCGEWLGFGSSAQSHFNEPWDTGDRIMLGLRLVKGVPCELLAAKTGEVERFTALGFLQIKNGRISCTGQGFELLNQILCKLI